MSGHFDKFYSLEPEKKERIVAAALDEVAEKGFKKASTNAIVKRAGISKGMLFYYFGSKEELFDFLFSYIIEFIKGEYMEKFLNQVETRDFIERCKSLAALKKYVISTHPKMIKFYEHFFLPGNEEYFNKYATAITEITQIVRKGLYEDVDYSLFREGVAPEAVLTYIRWLTERYEQEFMNKLGEEASTDEQFEKAFNAYDALLLDLKKIFYKDHEEED